jgi:predicted alpha/beta hydrolase family esterase
MEKQQVFYIHGGESYSQYEDYLDDLKTKEIRDLPTTEGVSMWTKTFRGDLGDAYEVFTPSMPNKQNAQYNEWKIWFERHFAYLKDGVILVGWSLGAVFLARYLSENKTLFSIKYLFLLAAPYDYFVSPGSKEDGGDFYPDAEKVSSISDVVHHIIIMHSKDDFVVPYEHALKYKAALPAAELITFEDKNHFLVEELPELVQKIRNLA